MNMKLTVVLCALISLAGSAFAELEPPGIVVDGLNALWRSGGKAALDVWQRGSANVNPVSPDGFAEIEKAYGRMLGYETIQVVPITGSMQRVYMLIKYERGPAFASFDCYKPEANWIIALMNYGVKPGAVLPERMLAGRGK